MATVFGLNYILINPFTRTVKPQVTQSCLTFDSVDRALNCDHSLGSS